MKKRIFDLALTIPALFVLAPVIVVLIVLLRFSMGKGIFFYQNRPGLRSKSFIIYKFRTMTDKRDENGKSLPDGDRLTRLGRFLRKTSMDPQITQIFARLKKQSVKFMGRIVLPTKSLSVIV